MALMIVCPECKSWNSMRMQTTLETVYKLTPAHHRERTLFLMEKVGTLARTRLVVCENCNNSWDDIDTTWIQNVQE